MKSITVNHDMLNSSLDTKYTHSTSNYSLNLFCKKLKPSYKVKFLKMSSHSKKCSLSPAQYWKVSKTSNLVNKSGKWQFSSLKWSLPEENCEGPITDNASGKILDIVDQESLVDLVDIEDASLLSNGQKWIKAKQNKDGWFMLINPSSNKVLTALTATTTSISGFYNNSYTFLYILLIF